MTYAVDAIEGVRDAANARAAKLAGEESAAGAAAATGRQV